jgi:hypothetical protein
MRTNLVNSNKLRELMSSVFLGVSGALMGSTYGSGVGKSLPELFLALFLIILASIFSIENLLLRSREHLLILISGAVVGLVIEYFTQSTIVIVIGGALVGICTLPLLSRIGSFIAYFVQTAPFIYYAILLIIGIGIFTPLCLWASSRGILRETLIAVAFLTSPFWVGYIILKLQ